MHLTSADPTPLTPSSSHSSHLPLLHPLPLLILSSLSPLLPSLTDQLTQNTALPFNHPLAEKISLNIDTLWSGGPFSNTSYNGANPPSPVYPALSGIRDWIFRNGTGNVSAIMGDGIDDADYGSFYVLGNLSVGLRGVILDGNGTGEYRRELDLKTGIHTTEFGTGERSFTSQIYCSHPNNVCIYGITSNTTLPLIDIAFENLQSNTSLIQISCSISTRSALLNGITQADVGMTFKAQARVLDAFAGTVSCTDNSGVLTISPSAGQKTLTLVIAAGTDYDERRSSPTEGFSFRGVDPGPYIAAIAAAAACKNGTALRQAHIADFSALMNRFVLELPDPLHSAEKETAEVIAAYNVPDNSHTDPWLESLQFEYGRYLFVASSRKGALPPNLQGKWAYAVKNAWGADYHANINLQMNHWGVDQTGLGDLQSALWTYMAETGAPRGAETAELLYDAPGWVTHDEMNIFGHTGMKKGDEYWADYPASAAWMMLHVADHFDYSRDLVWLEEVGYPMLEAISMFWLSQLQEDEYFDDGTLVVNPCSSPEHGPTTFACTHYQQLVHSLFTNTIQASQALTTPNSTFTTQLTSALSTLDKGLHINSENLIQEWKLPIDLDSTNDTHRHLSHLVGWYPGSSLSSYLHGYTNTTINSAIHDSLIARGPGIADANAGWEKVWRAACWARLNDTETAYSEIRLTLKENMADNLLSMYSEHSEPFQIDANFGYVGAVLSMLVVDLAVGIGEEGLRIGEVRTVVLGPAIPAAWAGGCVRGLRVRGGGVLDFRWDGEGVVTEAKWVEMGEETVRVVNKKGVVLLL